MVNSPYDDKQAQEIRNGITHLGFNIRSGKESSLSLHHAGGTVLQHHHLKKKRSREQILDTAEDWGTNSNLRLPLSLAHAVQHGISTVADLCEIYCCTWLGLYFSVWAKIRHLKTLDVIGRIRSEWVRKLCAVFTFYHMATKSRPTLQTLA